MTKQYEITYTFFGKERPVFSIAAENQADAISKFRIIKPAVSVVEIQPPCEVILAPVNEKKLAAARARIGKLGPRALTETEVFLLSKKDTKVRFLWAPRVNDEVRQRFFDLGRSLPLEALPIETGKNGGITELFSLSCEVFLPVAVDFDAATFPDATLEKGILHIYDVALGLELFCNQGFTGIFKGVESEED